ncbi:glycosyltransferase family 39 protein [Streptomyces sp. NPDC002851]
MSATTEAPHRPRTPHRTRQPRTTPPRTPRRRTDQLRRSLRRAAPALYAYLCVRLFVLLVLSTWAHTQGLSLLRLLATEWDANWYLGIAENGYALELGTAYDANNLAFFPLYPMLLRFLGATLPGPTAAAGLAVSFVASFVAAWGIFAVGNRLYGRRAGVLLVALWAALPVGQVQWMAYTESLFTAFAAWSLYAVLTGRWLWAGTLATLSGLTRPTGIAVAAAVSLAALMSLRKGITARALAGAALAPVGWLLYVGWVGQRVGRWDGYFAVQRLWHNELDGGLYTLTRFRDHFVSDSTPELFLIMVSLTLIAAALLFVWSVRQRQPLPLLVFSGLIVAITLGSAGVYFPRARFLLPAYPLLMPIAVLLARLPVRYVVVALSAALVGAGYCSAYMVLVWPSAP